MPLSSPGRPYDFLASSHFAGSFSCSRELLIFGKNKQSIYCLKMLLLTARPLQTLTVMHRYSFFSVMTNIINKSILNEVQKRNTPPAPISIAHTSVAKSRNPGHWCSLVSLQRQTGEAVITILYIFPSSEVQSCLIYIDQIAWSAKFPKKQNVRGTWLICLLNTRFAFWKKRQRTAESCFSAVKWNNIQK